MSGLIDKLAGIQSKQRLALVLGAVAGIFVAFFMLSYRKSQQELAEIMASVEKTKPTVEQLQAIERKLPKFEEDLRKLGKRLEVSRTMLPEKNEIPELLTQISRLGNQSGLEFMSFTPGSEDRQSFYAEVPVAIVVRGGYHDLGEFLDRIRTLYRIVHVRNLSLGEMQVENGMVTISAKSILVTYRFLSTEEEKEAAAAREAAKAKKK